MDQFKKDYPDSSLMSFEASKDKNPLWGDGKMIRIVEYFTREIEKKKLYLMQNREGQLFVTKEEPDMERLPEFGWQLMKERDVESHEVKWCKANQSEILEKQTKWPGKYIPIVMVYGKEINIEGKTKYRGMVRYGKDSQRLYNMFRSTGAEVIALTPKSPYLVTSKMISNYQSKWDTAHKKNYPYLPYDPDPSNAQLIPRRAEPIMASSGIAQEVNIADQEMHDTLGLQQSSLGQKSNEKSGRAIMARQKEGDTAQYPYYDNLGRAMKYEARILIDLIPKIYDTARIIRIMNEDGSGSFVPVNQPFVEQGQNGGEAIQRIYDLAVGKYDAMVSIGPSFTTQREEAAQSMIAFIEAVPAAAPLIGDLLAKNLDWPGAQEIEKRLKLLLPPQLQGGEGGQPPKPPPPDVNQIMAQRGEAAKIQGNELDNEMKFHQMERLKRGQTPEPKEAKQ
jgi:hypothetical protein